MTRLSRRGRFRTSREKARAATTRLPLPAMTGSNIAEGNDEISGLRGEVAANPVVIGKHQEVHGWEPCQLSSNACRMCAMAVFLLQRNWFAKALRSSWAGLGLVL